MEKKTEAVNAYGIKNSKGEGKIERERELGWAITKGRPTKTSPEPPKQNWIAPCE